jgi:uncharacterized protein (DUF1501 family)
MNESCSCSEYARAGAGLPAVEPGMPVPAGTGLDRRAFVARGVGLALSVYGASRLPLAAFQDGIARAAAAPAQRVVVSVFLSGGVDALSLLFPAGDPLYRTLRPKLALDPDGATAFAGDPRLFWHPAAAPLATLYGEKKVTVLPAVGYSDPDQSHFTSRHYWEVGATDPRLLTGWLGRYLDRAGARDNPLQGLSLDGQLQPALATRTMPVAAIDGPDDFGLSAGRVWGDVADAMLDALEPIGSVRHRDPALAAAADAALQTARLRKRLAPFAKGISSPVAYPSGRDAFPHRLAGLAAMLGAGLPLRCVALTAPGMYDTHANQPDALATGLKLTCDSLLAFQRDLEARGLADRVLVHVWSEFGRRAAENGSLGTDHGAAGSGLLIGSRVAGGLIGEYPGLDKLDERGNLRATADFRGLYAAILEQWLGADADAIIPGARGFARPTLLA